MTVPHEGPPSSKNEPPVSRALQFFVGIGGAIVITIVLFAAVAAGIQIRGAAWIIVFLCIWLLTFVALRLRLHLLIWGFAFGSFIMLFALKALGYPVF